jgi:hypothetical protein
MPLATIFKKLKSGKITSLNPPHFDSVELDAVALAQINLRDEFAGIENAPDY